MNVLICDDQADEAGAVRLLVENAAKRFDVPVSLKMYDNPKTMLFETEDPKTWPDLVCIDVNMPQMLGTDAVRALRKRGQRCDVIFFSVLRDVHILLEAFNVRATNYFLKDELDQHRFDRVFADVARRVEDDNRETVVFSCGSESRSIEVRTIDYFEVNKRIITVHYGTEQFEFYSRLDRIALTLEGRGFVRTHRSYLVAVASIAKVEGAEVILQDGTVIPLSRTYAPQVRKLIKPLNVG